MCSYALWACLYVRTFNWKCMCVKPLDQIFSMEFMPWQPRSSISDHPKLSFTEEIRIGPIINIILILEK